MHDIVKCPVQRHVPHIVLVGENEPRRNIVQPLASIVGRFLVKQLVAFAVERAGCVEAMLAACPRDGNTLINVCAGAAVGKECVAGRAVAVKRNWSVYADLGAAAVLSLAFIHVAVRWFVRVIRTIRRFVASFLVYNAVFPVVARVVCFRVAGGRVVVGQGLWTIHFVTSVPAVVLYRVYIYICVIYLFKIELFM